MPLSFSRTPSPEEGSFARIQHEGPEPDTMALRRLVLQRRDKCNSRGTHDFATEMRLSWV